MISDDAAEVPLAMKWASIVVTVYGLSKFSESLLIVNLTSSACIEVERPVCLITCKGVDDAVEKMYIFPWSLPHATMEESSAKTPTLMHLFSVGIANV